MKRVAVALSGGVDSAVAALLLKQQGYEVVGVTGMMLQNSEMLIQNAKNVAEKLGIEHYVVDVTKEFNSKVIDYFETSYINGYTPNPCTVCNSEIKWGLLLDYAINNLGCDYIATGHYADIRVQNEVYKLYPAKDTSKDQVYFLFNLNQYQLSKTIFPLADYLKDEIRDIAIKYDLPPKSAKDSQDICFIPKSVNLKNYLLSKFGEKKGDFVDIKSGKKLGEHNGCMQYTQGQRKGIGIASANPLYVVNTDVKSNAVFLGGKEDLFSSELTLNHINWVYPVKEKEFYAKVKIRYNMQPVKSKIVISENNIDIKFDTPVSAITKGQACVIYHEIDGHLLGGAYIF